MNRMPCSITDGEQYGNHDIACECLACKNYDQKEMDALHSEMRLERAREVAESVNEAIADIFGFNGNRTGEH